MSTRFPSSGTNINPELIAAQAEMNAHRQAHALKRDIQAATFRPLEACVLDMDIPTIEKQLEQNADMNLMAARLMQGPYDKNLVLNATVGYLASHLTRKQISPEGIYCIGSPNGSQWLVLPESLVQPLKVNMRTEATSSQSYTGLQ